MRKGIIPMLTAFILFAILFSSCDSGLHSGAAGADSGLHYNAADANT